MFGAMTSLTGGGGLSNSSSASGQTGDQKSSIGFQGGSINFGTQNSGAASGGSNMALIAIAVVAILLYWRR